MIPRRLPAWSLLCAALLPFHADAQESFDDCLKQLRGVAATHEIAPATFEQHVDGLEPDMAVIGLLDYQPEFRTPIWDYLAGLVDDERVADGRAMAAQWAGTLQDIEARYGVDPATVVAVWGVESNFGRNFGKRPLLVSLATLSCFGRRQAFFRGEFFTALKIIEDGHVAPQRLAGSWAGAFGHTQFMPSTFKRVAVDFDGDGRRDLIDSVPDALASTANFLREAGWQTGRPWGFEVVLPPDFDAELAGRRNKRALSEWVALGVRRADGSAIEPGTEAAGLLLPAGERGPAFLVLRNFDALYSYNAAESYALAITHLSDRLRGGEPFRASWPTDDPGLSRAERREVQALLSQLGYDAGEADGVLGARSREAVQQFQRGQGLEPDGRAGRRVLELLRKAYAER